MVVGGLYSALLIEIAPSFAGRTAMPLLLLGSKATSQQWREGMIVRIEIFLELVHMAFSEAYSNKQREYTGQVGRSAG